MYKKLFLSVFSFAFSTGIFAQTVILDTDFQSGIPANYSLIDNDGLTPDSAVIEYAAAPWIAVQEPDSTTNIVAATTSYFDPAGTASRWLITPQLALTSGNTMEWKAKSQDASFTEDYLVLISTTDTAVASFTDTLYYQLSESDEWTTHTVSISDSGYTNVNVYLAFVDITTDGYKLYIDDIKVTTGTTAGIASVSPVTASLYPNPASTYFSIKSNKKIELVRVYSPAGNLLYSGNDDQISIADFPSGIYLIDIETAAGISKQKLVKY